MGQLAKVMRELADVDASRLCQSSIINAMMLAYDSNEKSTGEFFAKLCKKINPQSLKYEHFQKTVDILMLVMERGDHELTIFEALLGLVNLTGGTTKVTVSVSRLEKCFF